LAHGQGTLSHRGWRTLLESELGFGLKWDGGWLGREGFDFCIGGRVVALDGVVYISNLARLLVNQFHIIWLNFNMEFDDLQAWQGCG
jgi:hypothetical protein